MFKKSFFISFITLVVILKLSNPNSSITTKVLHKQATPKEIPVARLVINSLDIDQPIYNYHSKNNTVEKNVQLLEGSNFPDYYPSIIFLAAHSGNSSVSYFNHLNQLKIHDSVILLYKNNQYQYKVTTIYEQEKDGDIEVNKESDFQLVLTTCSPTHKDKQLIVICNLDKKEKYK